MSTPDADRRTHAPTDRRVQDFRKRGEIALSRDTTAIATLIGGFIGARQAGAGLHEYMSHEFAELGSHGLFDAIGAAGGQLMSSIAPVLAGALFGYVASTVPQLGFPPAFAPWKFDPSRSFSPNTILQILSPKAIVGRGAKAFAKVAAVLFAGAWTLKGEWSAFVLAPALDPAPLGARIVGAASRLFWVVGGSLAVLGAYEYVSQRRELTAKMRMTIEEVKREHKEQEGDPQIKRRRRQRMRELARRRLMTAVQGADVVVVNPTEYAVAIRYKQGEDRAPRVVAKGRKAQAERIRAIARTAGIPIMAQPPLARWLYKSVPEGREIPGDTYRAVAEVLAYVYRLRRRRG